MPKTHFREKTLENLDQGEWTDPRYPNLKFRVGAQTRAWYYRPPRRADGSRPGGNLGRYPDLNLAAAIKKYNDEKGRLARGELHPDPEKRIQELEAELRALKRATGKLRTFGDLAERFMTDYVPKSGRPLSAKTRHQYEQVLRDFALPIWQDRDVDYIEDTEVEALLSEIKARGTPFTANRLLKLLKTMFSFGLKRKIATVNPCAHISKLRDNERDRILSPKELRAAWLAFSKVSYGQVFQLLILTWQRRNECVQMPWSEIQDNWWHLPATRSKNGHPNLIYLAPLSRRILSQGTTDSSFVFRGRTRKDQAVDASHISKLCASISRQLAKDGAITSPFMVHDLRRTAATMARSNGEDRRVVKTILNHRSNSVTDIYDLYEMQREIQETLTAWDRYVTDLVGLKSVDE